MEYVHTRGACDRGSGYCRILTVGLGASEEKSGRRSIFSWLRRLSVVHWRRG